MAEENYKEGLRHGDFTVYEKDKIEVITYQNNVKITMKVIDPKTKKVLKTQKFYPDGSKAE